MGYLSNYRYDVFLSYAHIDNETADPAKEGWISLFYKDFRLRLGQMLGGVTEVWYDHELRKNHAFNQQIQDVIHDSAVFIGFMSNGFLNSQYCCDKELKFFFDINKTAQGVLVNNKSRILNLRLNKINYIRWPKELSGINPYDMFEESGNYSADNSDDIGSPGLYRSDSYEKTIKVMVQDVYSLLQDMKEATLPVVRSEEKSLIFLGRVSPKLHGRKGQLVDLLRSAGIGVFEKEIPPPWDKAGHAARIQQVLSTCQCSVHLLDELPGDIMEEGYEYTATQEQVRLALKLGENQFIFIPRELEVAAIADEGQRKFIEKLEGRSLEGSYAYVKESSPDNICQIITEHLRSRKEPPDLSRDVVLLDFHATDQQHAIEVCNQLTHDGKRVYFARAGQNPLDGIRNFKDVLNEVKTVIIICIEVSKDWLKHRLQEIIKAIKTENSPVQKLIVYGGDGLTGELDINTLIFLNS